MCSASIALVSVLGDESLTCDSEVSQYFPVKRLVGSFPHTSRGLRTEAVAPCSDPWDKVRSVNMSSTNKVWRTHEVHVSVCNSQQEEIMEIETGSEVSVVSCWDQRKQGVKQQQEGLVVRVKCLLVHELMEWGASSQPLWCWGSRLFS